MVRPPLPFSVSSNRAVMLTPLPRSISRVAMCGNEAARIAGASGQVSSAEAASVRARKARTRREDFMGALLRLRCGASVPGYDLGGRRFPYRRSRRYGKQRPPSTGPQREALDAVAAGQL